MVVPACNELQFRTGVDEEARLTVRRGLTAFNSERSAELRPLYAPEIDRTEPVEVYLTGPDGEILGGAYGTVRWCWFHLDVVWLTAGVRGGGMGTALMARVEQAAREAGATNVRLETLDFQARAFYEKCGYHVYGELQGFPKTHTEYLLTKQL